MQNIVIDQGFAVTSLSEADGLLSSVDFLDKP